MPGGSLGSTKRLRLKIPGFYNNTSGGNSVTEAFIASFGGTTFLSTSFRNFSNGTTGNCDLEIDISANGATNSQRANAKIEHISDTIAPGAGFPGNNTVLGAYFDTLAIDSTVAQTMLVQFQHGTANAAISYKSRGAVLELLG